MGYFVSIDKEEQLIVVLALYILELLHERKPKRMKVLRFIKARELAHFNDDDTDLRSTGEEKWMNDFSWARKDIKESALLAMPGFGIWQLTTKGNERLLQKAKRWKEIYEKDPASKTIFLKKCRRINATVFMHMIMLGRDEDIRKKPKIPAEPIGSPGSGTV